jgi:hypothetical protein
MFDLIHTHQCFNDLVKNKFDLSQFEDTKDKVLYKASSEKEIKDDDHTVEYRYNDEFFRSDNFIKDHNGMHVLFSGCSESEGVGDNIENAWTKILYDKISNNVKCSGFFNLSRSGWGWSKIITNALIYFEKYGYPDVYFILLPNHQRMHKFYRGDDGGSFWKHEQLYPKGYYLSREKNKETEKFISDEKEYNEDFLKFLLGWKLFNKICKDNNVKLIFSTWDELDSDNLDNLNMFENFLNMDIKNNCGTYINKWYETNEKTKYDLRKRDGHNGIIIHNFWADSFYSLWEGLQK